MKSKDYTTRIETIGPAQAQAMLDTMTEGQRSISERNVRGLIKEMNDGSFVLSNDCIVRTKSGTTLNGQHRMKAVVEVGKPQPFVVLTVPDSDAQIMAIMDSGKPRSVADHLSTCQVANSQTIAAAVPLILAYQRGLITTGGNYASTNRTAQDKFVSRSDVVAFVNTHIAQLSRGARHCRTCYEQSRLYSAGKTLAVWYLVYKAHNSMKKADAFVEDFYSGESERARCLSPLRNAISKNAAARLKAPASLVWASIVAAHGPWTRGERCCGFVRYNSKFPTI